ncbi:hypothetical protein GKC31_05180 [Lactobacillus curvatus]|nr:hypothetical protein [Latilactobacillus curvatus]
MESNTSNFTFKNYLVVHFNLRLFLYFCAFTQPVAFFKATGVNCNDALANSQPIASFFACSHLQTVNFELTKGTYWQLITANTFIPKLKRV